MDIERYMKYSIELDCAPGNPRPGDLIEGVLKGTKLKIEDFETAPPFFGHQTWVLKESANKDQIFNRHKYNTIKPRIEELYLSGYIRYGTW
jgi:hypothetical protein